MQRHHAGSDSWVVQILDAYQFNNGVIKADRCFGVVRRNEVFATSEVEESYAWAAQFFDCEILCGRDTHWPHKDLRRVNAGGRRCLE